MFQLPTFAQTKLALFAFAASVAMSAVLVASASAQSSTPASGAERAVSPMTINWDDLLPEGEMERIEELYRLNFATAEIEHFGAPMAQIGTFNIVEELIGQTIRMPGFILPLDAQPGGQIQEFLLVPYFGACIHTPPPPPNQIVYVVVEEPITVERLWAPVWVTGVMTSERNMNELGDAAYTLELLNHEPYER